MASRPAGAPAILLLLLAAGCACWVSSSVAAQSGKPAKSKPAPARSAAPVQEAGRYLVQVLAEEIDLHDGPLASEPVIARAAQGTYFEADARAGDWYRVRRARGGHGWIDAAKGEGKAVAVSAWPGEARLDYGAV